jgi:hypothetical protein
MSTIKEELTRLIQEQPDDSSREEIVRELAFHVSSNRTKPLRCPPEHEV